MIPFGERHLRRTIAEYVEHYHRERNHQGLGNALIDDITHRPTGTRIRRRPRLGGLLNYYMHDDSQFPTGNPEPTAF